MAFTFSIKDTYRQAVEAASGGKQTVLYDDKGYPSIMNIIPKLSYKDVGLSDSTKALPAFMVDDAEKPEIFVGTFMAMVHDGRACSLPGQVPKVYTNMDQAIAAVVIISAWVVTICLTPKGNSGIFRVCHTMPARTFCTTISDSLVHFGINFRQRSWLPA